MQFLAQAYCELAYIDILEKPVVLANYKSCRGLEYHASRVLHQFNTKQRCLLGYIPSRYVGVSLLPRLTLPNCFA